ncbi:RelA/SpoT domain-containing protein [Pseudomonas extremaustralis]|uniref:RelA/SpoT domain-containing protein n=1 Tax=Pseudomonas extremaustralis TaxID=359110 RepID=UPI0021C78644|nr:RelA/SpoT domain-containing protein [Pseudomonas extremaustralis]MDG2967199.1 RelA/SpoT domain-containing protein [Pseudomonas extremaustralis]UUJ43567.1 RelA/SpoT domain-containing protein [Pseudomonas extremaustralis]
MVVGFPGGSKSRVNAAGYSIRDQRASLEDMHAIDEWRAAHRIVLNTFQASLRSRTRGKQIIVAQRHKRKNTIFDKLIRLPKMELSRMDDVAGCRLIFRSIEELYEFRESFHKARFNHKRKNESDKYDYIKRPKQTGYRGIHDVYSYDVRSKNGDQYRGLLLEIQYRTLVQHAWATAVEVIGFITESQPKFQQGDKRYENCMALASEILSRAHENRTGPFPDYNNRELLQKFEDVDKEIHIIRTLTGLNSSETVYTDSRNSILIFKDDGSLEVKSFKEAPDALRELFRLERDFPTLDVVLVKADTNEEIRMAFKNYFSDAKDFIKLLTEGQQILELID